MDVKKSWPPGMPPFLLTLLHSHRLPLWHEDGIPTQDHMTVHASPDTHLAGSLLVDVDAIAKMPPTL